MLGGKAWRGLGLLPGGGVSDWPEDTRWCLHPERAGVSGERAAICVILRLVYAGLPRKQAPLSSLLVHAY